VRLALGILSKKQLGLTNWKKWMLISMAGFTVQILSNQVNSLSHSRQLGGYVILFYSDLCLCEKHIIELIETGG